MYCEHAGQRAGLSLPAIRRWWLFPRNLGVFISILLQTLEPLAGEVEALRSEAAANEETLTDCLTSLGQEEAKVGGGGLLPGKAA